MRRLAAALACPGLAVVLALAAQADGSHVATGGDRPATYTAGVHRVRDELSGIDRAVGARDLRDVSRRAARIVELAGSLPAFADTLASAAADSGAAIRRASADLAAAAGNLGIVADRGDTEFARMLEPNCASAYARLDAYVVKQYVCPMHCEFGKVYAHQGNCPVCGMVLQLVTEDRYAVAITPDHTPLRAGVPVMLHFQLTDPAGFEVRDLQVVHEKLLHLMIVSQDLAFFEHVHPVPAANGAFDLRTTFPAGGTYTLFHDFTPGSVGMQVVPVEVKVEGTPRAPVALVIDDTLRKRVAGCDVKLTHTALGIDFASAMTFALSRGGKPVTDLEPYLGAMGHLVMISEDRQAFVHSHPLATAAPNGRVEFDMVLARTGRYRAWGQFQRHGKVITVPFVVEVTVDGHSHLGASSGGASDSR